MLALLRNALDVTGTGFVLTDPREQDNPIVYVNQSFLEMTGYAADEVLGRNCRFLQGRDTDPARVDELRRAVQECRPATVELRNYRRDGSAFWNEVHIAPVRDERGDVVRFVGVHVDVTSARGAQTAERRSAFLSEAGPLLDASLDLRSTLDSLTRLSVPYLGDVCLVDVIEFREVRRLAAAAADPAVERLVRALPITLSGATGATRSHGRSTAAAPRSSPGPAPASSARRRWTRACSRPTSRAPRCSCRSRRAGAASGSSSSPRWTPGGATAPTTCCWPRISRAAPRSRWTTPGSTRTSARSRGRCRPRCSRSGCRSWTAWSSPPATGPPATGA